MDRDGADDGGSDGGTEGTNRRVDPKRVAGDDETTTEKLEEAGRKVWLMPDQEGSLLLVLRLCQAQPQRDDNDRHLPGH